MKIPLELKQQCVKLKNEGLKANEIYEKVFYPNWAGEMNLDSFSRVLRKWAKAVQVDDTTLKAGTYEGFFAHGATVQVNSAGEITQAWIKESRENVNWPELVKAFTDKVEPVNIQRPEHSEKAMLEIPFFDMHFGVATLENYGKVLSETVDVIRSKAWEEINIIFGQDMLHTNDMRGHTAKGTDIQRIDVPKAWNDAWNFWTAIINTALECAKVVHIRYSKGNHDECLAWCFLKTLEAKYPDAEVEDTLSPRKVIFWRGCFIGYGHCEYTKKAGDLFRDFVVDFPKEFSSAKVREIHAGHLHRESEDSGFMVRRLASAVPVDEWSNNNGFASAQKRFQLFEWQPNRLKAIYYIK